MSSPDLERLFRPQSIAVIGASPGAGKIGNVLMRNLATFAGTIYPVHPKAEEVLGHRAYRRVSEIPAPVDLALLAIPAEAAPQAIEDCARAGVGAAIIYSGGWGETGAAGLEGQNKLLAIAKPAGLRLIGPNTSGLLRPGLGLFATFVADLPETLKPGKLAILAQSGGVNLTLCFMAASAGLGVSLGLGLGNAADLGFADCLDWLATRGDSDDVSALILATEGIPEGRALYDALARLSPRLPVIAMTVGRNDIGRFAQSHTGALTGSYRVKRAALEQAGAIVVERSEDLIDAAAALSLMRLPPRPAAPPLGVGLVTGQAGPGLMLADALASRGLSTPTLPESVQSELSQLLPPLTYQSNPVDTGRPGPSFPKILRLVRESEGIELLAVSLLHEPDAADPIGSLRGLGPALMCSQGPRAELDSVAAGLRSERIALYPSPERVALAAWALASDARARFRRSEEPEANAPLSAIQPGPDGWNEARAKDLLAELGLASPRRQICPDRAAAHQALRDFAEAVAVKVLDATIQHKTELGCVHLNVRSPSELDAALDAIERARPGAALLLESMAPAGPELLLGARRDPAFGPLVLLGAGGVGAEAEDDVVIRLAPLSLTEAMSMLPELRSAWRFRGWRGGPQIDEIALAKALTALAALISQRRDISELEVNPLRVTANGLIALDALVIGRPEHD